MVAEESKEEKKELGDEPKDGEKIFDKSKVWIMEETKAPAPATIL